MVSHFVQVSNWGGPRPTRRPRTIFPVGVVEFTRRDAAAEMTRPKIFVLNVYHSIWFCKMRMLCKWFMASYAKATKKLLLLCWRLLNDLLYSAGRLGGTADSNELLPAARPKMNGLGWLGCMSQFCQFLLLFRVVSSQHVFILVQPKCFLISEKYFWYIFHLSDFSPGGI